MNKKLLFYFIFLLISSFSNSIHADVIWPTLLIKTTHLYNGWIFVILGLLIEWIILLGLVENNWNFKKYSKQTLTKTFLITLLMNVISLIAGTLLGFIFDIIFVVINNLISPNRLNTLDNIPGPQFNQIYLPPFIIFSVFMSTIIETYIVSFFYPSIRRMKIFKWMMLANTISTLIAAGLFIYNAHLP